MLQHHSNRLHFLRKHARSIAALSAGFLLIVVVLVLALASPVQATAPAAPAAPTPPPCTDGIQGYVLNELHLPLSGWTVEAYPKGNPAAKMTTTTNGEGYFEFSPLTAGDWVVNLVPETGWVPVPPTQMTVEVTVGAGAACAQVFFKMQQATPTPTATWTPGPPATRLRGYVYELTCDGMVPVANVTLNAWRSDAPDALDSVVKTVMTDGGGFYNFYLPTTPPPYYHIIVEPPPGLEAYQATSLEGVVVDVDHIRINAPGYMVYEDNIFILRDPNLKCGTDTPTPTPTETPTPTNTP
ncbi:MAG: hypothetical protein GXP42_06260, partial [Chloroflexi bacterium]|nr:hypothetical protein [Chloroflexota bacterium]